MKRLLSLLSVATLALAVPASAEILQQDVRALRFDVFADEDAIDDSSLGFEFGFGQALYPMDEVGLFVGYKSTDSDARFRLAGLYIEEHYPVGMIAPFAGLDFAYAEVEDGFGGETDGFLGRLRLGVKLFLSEHFNINAAVRWGISSNDVFLDGKETDDQKIDVSAGVRFYF